MSDFTIGAPIAYILGLKVLASCSDTMYPTCPENEADEVCVHFPPPVEEEVPER